MEPDGAGDVTVGAQFKPGTFVDAYHFIVDNPHFLAVKALDGADRAMGPALNALAARSLGLEEAPASLAPVAQPRRLNVHGAVVGELIAVLPD